MKIDIKGHIDMAGMTKLQRLRKVLGGLQEFHLNNLKEAKKRLENMRNVIQTPGFDDHTKSH